MQIVNLTIGMVLLAALAMLVQNYLFKKVSVNYISFALGMLITLVPTFNFSFNPEFFMGIIIAPLLFFEGQQNRIYSIARSWRSIISITVIMIIIATTVDTLGLKWLFGLSFPVSLILAAISTPTDATATESVIHGLKIPAGVSKYLKNKSLFNDASGIILLNMGVSWYTFKHLEVWHTFIDFLYSAGGGIILGLVFSFVLILLRQKIMRLSGYFSNENFTTMTPIVVIYILTPILLYYLAEHIHVSGIIAVVVVGLAHNAEFERSKLTDVYNIYNDFQISHILSEILNSVVFIGLGTNIVLATRGNLLPNRIDLAIEVGVLLYVVNILVRYIYSYLVLKLGNKDAWIFSLGGIHGAVTYALAYTLDNTLVSVNNFHLVLFSEATLILLSMIVPTFLFRFILPKDKPDIEKKKVIDQVKEEMVNYALAELDKIYLPKKFRKQLIFDLHAQINETSIEDFLRELKKSIKQPELTPEEHEFRDEIYRYAFRLERNYLGQIAQKEQEYRSGFLTLYREILLAEVLYLHSEEE